MNPLCNPDLVTTLLIFVESKDADPNISVLHMAKAGHQESIQRGRFLKLSNFQHEAFRKANNMCRLRVQRQDNNTVVCLHYLPPKDCIFVDSMPEDFSTKNIHSFAITAATQLLKE